MTFDVTFDLCIYGGTSAGVAAAIQGRRSGLSVLLLSTKQRLGGLTTGGLGATDIGNKEAIGGISREFYERTGAVYGIPEAWTFEPHVAENVLETMLAECGPAVERNVALAGVTLSQDRAISSLSLADGRTVSAKVFIDATYEGDLLAAAGVDFHVGRESNATYGETLNGIYFGHPNHNFKVAIDPYVREGDPSSGLLPGIMDAEAGQQGSGDACVQAYNFRMCLTKSADRLPFPKPEGYDSERYTLFARYLNAGVWDAFAHVWMPNGKTDTNNCGGFSTDNIGRNFDYPNGDAATRQAIYDDHLTYQQGMMWFLCHDERVPSHVREEMLEWGLPRDEFVAVGGWPDELYVREARRLVGETVMTEHHCLGSTTAEDSIGLAAYTIDSHNCRRLVVDGRVINEGNVETGFADPFPIAYSAMLPKRSQCVNLLVPVCLSASHTAFGSIRMEPVFMILGQSAAAAAALAIDSRCNVYNIDIENLQSTLRRQGQRLSWPYRRPEL